MKNGDRRGAGTRTTLGQATGVQSTDWATRDYNPAADRERVRGYIALALAALFCVLVIVLLVAALAGWLVVENLEKLAAVLVSPVAGLLGAVVGFYYGEQSRRG